VQRRLTGGPALYVDERQLGWELFLHRRDLGPASLHSISRRICHAAATAISALGVDARYRAQSAIEIAGRTIGSGAIAVDGEALLFQGVLWLDLDAERMREVLRAPAVHSTGPSVAHELRAGLHEFLARPVDLRLVKHNLVEAFESEFDVEFREGELSLSEERRFVAALSEIDTQGWIDLVISS
jgi:lipoate-protein ligase A